MLLSTSQTILAQANIASNKPPRLGAVSRRGFELRRKNYCCGVGDVGGVVVGAGAPGTAGMGVGSAGAEVVPFESSPVFFLSLKRVLSLVVVERFFFLVEVSPANPKGEDCV